MRLRMLMRWVRQSKPCSLCGAIYAPFMAIGMLAILSLGFGDSGAGNPGCIMKGAPVGSTGFNCILADTKGQ
jgi:hypothetical protein